MRSILMAATCTIQRLLRALALPISEWGGDARTPALTELAIVLDRGWARELVGDRKTLTCPPRRSCFDDAGSRDHSSLHTRKMRKFIFTQVTQARRDCSARVPDHGVVESV